MTKQNKKIDSDPKGELLNAFSFIFVFIMIFIMGLQKNYSPDVGFHLQSAKWMLENKQFIRTDSFTYTSNGNNYYDLQWLYQLIIYGIHKIGKDALLIIINSTLITLSFLLVWLRCKVLNPVKVNDGLSALIFIIAIQALPFEIRPHVFSWVLLGVLLLVLEQYTKEGKKNLYLLPIIMLFWINTHSLAILGLVVIGIYCAGIYFETKKIDKSLLKFCVFSLITFLVNPYFIEGLIFPFSQLGIIKGEALQKSYIGEIQSPFTFKEFKSQGLAYFLNPLFYLQLYSLTSFVVAIKLIFKKRITEALLILAFFIILFMALKNYGYFLMVSLPIVINYSQLWLEERKSKAKDRNFKLSKRLQISSIVLAVVISWITITDGFSILRHSPYHFGLSIDKESVPVDAVDFLNSKKIYGKIMNHLDFGGYLMYNYPQKVFIDGRIELPKPDFFKKYYEGLKPSGFEKLLLEYDPDIILLPYNKATGWWSYLINTKAYRPVYFDGLSAVYLKNGKFNEVPELNEVSVNACVDTAASNNMASYIGMNKPNTGLAVLHSFFQKQYYPIDEQNKATFCFTYGYMKAALYYSACAIEKATVNPKNTFYNLELYFKSVNKFTEAEVCRKKSKL